MPNYYSYKKFCLFSTLLLSILTMSGCIEVDAVIALKEDGSGRIMVREILTAAGIQRLKRLKKDQKLPLLDLNEYFTNIRNQDYLKLVKSYSQGLEFNSARTFTTDSGDIGKISVYTFKNINDLKFLNKKTGKFGKIEFNYTGNKLIINSEPGIDLKTEIGKLCTLLKAIPQNLEAEFAGMSISVTLRTSKKIQSTNAYYILSNKEGITLLQADIGRLIGNTAALRAIELSLAAAPGEIATLLQPYQQWLKLDSQRKLKVSF